ncbi:MAG: type III-B CRISPR module-associated Cmr3 family protein [Cyanobium sp.]
MNALPFKHLVLLEPLGLLYGSSGRMLSPQALTGRASEHFPPDSPTIAGLIAKHIERPTNLPKEETPLWKLHTAGPFCFDSSANELWLPAPLTLLQDDSDDPSDHPSAPRLQHLQWDCRDGDGPAGAWHPSEGQSLPRKARTGGWVSLSQWPLVGDPSAASGAEPLRVHPDPWQAVPHLHPRLSSNERVSATDDALFLEYGIALQPGFRLAYLSSHAITPGRYRFGGEGHLVEVRCEPLPPLLVSLLEEELAGPFALITPGLWGGPRLSRREPLDTSRQPAFQPWHRDGAPPAILTERPRPWRHQLGASTAVPQNHQRPRLSRGRWAVPAGTCYRVPDGLAPWVDWPESWFPKEGFSFKQFGTALALPLQLPSNPHASR